MILTAEAEDNEKENVDNSRGTANHRGRAHASHPAVPGSNRLVAGKNSSPAK